LIIKSGRWIKYDIITNVFLIFKPSIKRYLLVMITSKIIKTKTNTKDMYDNILLFIAIVVYA